MRTVSFVSACVMVIWSSAGWAGGSWCTHIAGCADRPATPWTLPEKAETVSPEGYSSFRGITLLSSIHDLDLIAARLGLSFWTTTFVGRGTISSIDLCRRCDCVGTIDFDQQGRILRLMFHSGFFAEGVVNVREFADTLFERYSIRPLKLDDDICFQDVTCFRGTSRMGEQFLFLRIGGDLQLYVRPERPAEKGANTD